MPSNPELLSSLQRVLGRLERDLRQRAESEPEIREKLTAQYNKAKADRLTAAAYPVWRDEQITQIGVAWLLGGVFVRFLEDNDLLDHPWLSGPGERLARAREQHEAYFRQHPLHSDTDYFEHVFRQVATLPSLDTIFDREDNPLWTFGPTGDMADELLRFWQAVDPDTGRLVHDFTDPTWSTRFLGDLYQDLSEAARKKYALLQTPEFIEEFILDRTLKSAIETFGLNQVRMIDPTCGSGHFLLGAFHRLLDRIQKAEPGTPTRDLVQRALDAVHGIDLNPFAITIARFRLLIAALRACDIHKLRHAPAFRIHLAVGDSLLYGPAYDALPGGMGVVSPTIDAEELSRLQRILRQRYHAVVGNPPYITVKDASLNQLYRERFGSCHRKYSLAAPFMELFFYLAVKGDAAGRQPAGYVGMITANSFMKREFGKKLIEEFIPRWDLTHVIDTSGAYIPGHGTPTVILFGKHQPPVAATIRAVMGIKGEPSTPDDPAHGLVWSAILAQIDQPGSQSDFVSVADTLRESFHGHPWSIGGGGAAELKERLDESAATRLERLAAQIGITAVTGEDDLYILPDQATPRRLRIEATRPLVLGDLVRDWVISPSPVAVWIYGPNFELNSIKDCPSIHELLWLGRAIISRRKRFGTPMRDRGLTWYEWQELYADKLRTPLTITFGEVATHNHFALDRGGKVFNRTAPVIKLPADATEEDHLALLGILNSSTSCFWLKQVCFPKGGDHQGSEGARVRATLWDERFAFNSTQIANLPLPQSGRECLTLRARGLDRLAQALQAHSPARTLRGTLPTPTELGSVAETHRNDLLQMIALQEELDWECYRLYGLIEEDLTFPADQVPGIQLGERAFEIVLARRMAVGEEKTEWFSRHGSTPITDIPTHWPKAYRKLVERRIQVIEENPNIRLIERPEYKRRWNVEPWDQQLERALRDWILLRLESYFFGGERMLEDSTNGSPDTNSGERASSSAADPVARLRASWPGGQRPMLVSTHQLADCARADADFMARG